MSNWKRYLPTFKFRLTEARNRIDALEAYASVLEQYVDPRVVITDGKTINDHALHAEILVVSGDNIRMDCAYLKSEGSKTKMVLKDCRNMTISNFAYYSDAPMHSLIAAAHDLLAAVKDNHQWHLDYGDTGAYSGSELERANLDAIAKAEKGIEHE